MRGAPGLRRGEGGGAPGAQTAQGGCRAADFFAEDRGAARAGSSGARARCPGGGGAGARQCHPGKGAVRGAQLTPRRLPCRRAPRHPVHPCLHGEQVTLSSSLARSAHGTAPHSLCEERNRREIWGHGRPSGEAEPTLPQPPRAAGHARLPGGGCSAEGQAAQRQGREREAEVALRSRQGWTSGTAHGSAGPGQDHRGLRARQSGLQGPPEPLWAGQVGAPALLALAWGELLLVGCDLGLSWPGSLPQTVPGETPCESGVTRVGQWTGRAQAGPAPSGGVGGARRGLSPRFHSPGHTLQVPAWPGHTHPTLALHPAELNCSALSKRLCPQGLCPAVPMSPRAQPRADTHCRLVGRSSADVVCTDLRVRGERSETKGKRPDERDVGTCG